MVRLCICVLDSSYHHALTRRTHSTHKAATPSQLKNCSAERATSLSTHIVNDEDSAFIRALVPAESHTPTESDQHVKKPAHPRPVAGDGRKMRRHWVLDK
jgi:hypothetical protein